MLGVSGLMGDGAAEPHESGGASGGSSEVGVSSSVPGEESGGGGGGNRWPRQETLALLRIRSDMDVAFRDSSLKGPLWEEVSRKLGELGFHRSAKKCKEKFENVYKYHKRTKDGRASKSDGKTYRFFDQLQALENTPPPSFTPPPPRPMAAPPMPVTTVSSTSPNPLSVVLPTQTPTPFQPPPLQPAPAAISNPPQPNPLNFQNSTSSSSTSSDEDIQMGRGKKRKWKDFFDRLMKDVIQKQEELQKKFLETLEKRERDRMAREEAWRFQEMARMNREHDLLVQERSIAAAKDAAVIAFLQKVTEQKDLQIPVSNNASPPPQPQPQQPPPSSVVVPMQTKPRENPPQPAPAPPPPPPQPVPPKPVAAMQVVTTPAKVPEAPKQDNGGENSISGGGSSRWPKAEVQALINLRTSLDTKYQENGPKGPLWEEISSAMGKIGYNRSSKRCKEKWENINKYFKKVKESNKKRPEDSKTCPYFHQLEAIYKERSKPDGPSFSQGYVTHMAPIMARPEQQWPLPNQTNPHPPRDLDHDNGSNDYDDDDDEEEDEGGGYEIVTNKQPSSTTNAAE
ncbi:hypothetical protein ACS0TY_035840 [Phlomoides rotata]